MLRAFESSGNPVCSKELPGPGGSKYPIFMDSGPRYHYQHSPTTL